MTNRLQAPGQATTAALPTILAQQNGATPPPQVGQLSQMPVEQLKQLFFQSMQGGATVRPLSVLAAITKASDRERMQQEVMGQAAQQQAAQQPGTVRDEVLAQAQPAAGGIQALASGGPVQSFADGADEDGLMSRLPEDSLLRILGRWGTNIDAIERRLAEEASRSQVVPAAYTADESRPGPQALERAVRTAPAGVAALPAAPGRAAPAAAAAPATAGPGRAAPAAAGPAAGSLEALLMRQAQGNLPEIAALEKEAADNARRQREMLERMQGVPPEVAAARKRYEETVRGLYEPQRKAAEEARAATKQGLLSSPEALARLAAAASGKKRFGEALGATAGAAGEVLGERRKRAEQLEGEYRTLAAQRDMALAQAALADANGDEKRKQEMLLKAQEIDNALLSTRRDLFKTRSETQGRGIEGLTRLRGVRAQEAQANRPTEFQQRLELYRKDPNAYEAMFGSKEAERLAKIQAVVARDPLLVKYAEQAALNMPGAREKYNAQYTSLMARHAPELAGIAVTTSPPAGAQILK